MLIFKRGDWGLSGRRIVPPQPFFRYLFVLDFGLLYLLPPYLVALTLVSFYYWRAGDGWEVCNAYVLAGPMAQYRRYALLTYSGIKRECALLKMHTNEKQGDFR
jgi:hypothetical protein